MRSVASGFRNSLRDLSPEAIALIFSLGLVLGLFPVFGCPTVLCAMAAVAFRLNLPALQLINQVTSPLQFALLIPLGRAGAFILGAGAHPATGLRAASLIAGLIGAARNAVAGWFCLCVPLGLVLYLLLLSVLRYRRNEGAAR